MVKNPVLCSAPVQVGSGGMFCPPRSDGRALMIGARPAGVCPHGRRLYYCIACGGQGWCREHRRWRATCVPCGPPLATALCAAHPAQRRDRCPCRRRQSASRAQCDALSTSGSRDLTFTAAVGCPVPSDVYSCRWLPGDLSAVPVATGATGCESAAAVPGVRGSLRAARLITGGPAMATRSRQRVGGGVFQGTRSMLLRRGAQPAGAVLTGMCHGAVRKEPAGPMRRAARLGVRGCDHPLCRCDVDNEGYECKPLYMMTEAVYVEKTLQGAKLAEWRLLSGVDPCHQALFLVSCVCPNMTESCPSEYWAKRIFHLRPGSREVDLSRPRRWRSIYLFSRCLPAARMPPGAAVSMGVGEISIVPSVRERFFGDGPVAEYKSRKPHIRITYCPLPQPVGVASTIELPQP